MRLSDALSLARRPATGGNSRAVHLVCGSTPLHLETFLAAHCRVRFPDDAVHVRTGLYGDFEGNLARAAEQPGQGAALALEWSDIDPRLGLRSAAPWTAASAPDIERQTSERLDRIASAIEALAAKMPVALAAPTLAPFSFPHTPPVEASGFELRLASHLACFLAQMSSVAGVRVVNGAELARKSPPAARHDAKLDLHGGFPYTVAHADALAEALVACLFPAAPKKGLITDLDDTLWRGLLGEDGVEGISWSLADHAHGHALYQRLLASLAVSGTLIAAASKNEAELVERALGREDLLVPRHALFPVEASWSAKSLAVGRILKTWNIGADSVVFVDDSPMELAEVAARYPGIECVQFPAGDVPGILDLIRRLRTAFGRSEVLEEDRLRAESIRAAAAREGSETWAAGEDFLAQAEAALTLEYRTEPQDARAFELVNKTNQFNLNGRRFTEAEWRAYFEQPGALLVTAGYSDRFGPLGRIAVLAGRMNGDALHADVLVMSCRAFSRRIEHRMLRALFDRTGADRIRMAFRPTDRNGPLQEFLAALCGSTPAEGEVELSREQFLAACPALHHTVTEIDHG